VVADTNYGILFLNWIVGVAAIYAAMYGTGMLLFGNYLKAAIALSITVVAGVIIFKTNKS
jgi:hypothetical protein